MAAELSILLFHSQIYVPEDCHHDQDRFLYLATDIPTISNCCPLKNNLFACAVNIRPRYIRVRILTWTRTVTGSGHLSVKVGRQDKV